MLRSGTKLLRCAGSCSDASAYEQRSPVLYPAVSMASGGPEGHHGHPSRDARPLASGRLSSVLALEIALVWRAAAD